MNAMLTLKLRGEILWLLVALGVAATLLMFFSTALLRAQAEGPIEFAEESEGVVAVFTATDPEGKSVAWDVAAADADFSAVDGIETDDAADAALFEMSKSGELTFIDAPSYEAPAGGTSDDSNTYEVVITATDGTGDDAQTAYKKVTVEVTNVDEEPTTTIELSSLQPQVSTAITVDYVDGVGNPLVGADGTANAAIVDPDEDKTGASTTIPADDVKWQWSKSSSKTGRFTDISGAAAKMVTYTPASQDRGMYLRVTATYEDGEGEGKTVMATSAYPVRAFPSGNSAPSFPDDFDSTEDGNQPPTANVDDGATAGDAAGDPVTANDANNDRLTYSLEADSSGTAMHADVFQIDRMTGQVTVGLGKTVGPNGDSGETAARVPGIVLAPSGNEFTVTIKATDPSGSSATVVLTITADERDEAPVFTMGKTSHTHEENKPETEVVATFAAYDPEAAAVTYSLSGDDEGKLSIDSSSGALTFDASPDFEARGSADGDNVYEVTVKASDASTPAKSTSVDVTVTVTNVDEDGSVTLSASQPRIGVEIRANMPTDPDGGVTAVTWQWERADAAAFGETDNVTKIKDATRAGYTPVAADDGKYLRVTATYTDNEGSGKTAIGTPTATDPAVAKVRNLAPKFTDEDEDTDGIQIDPREVAENAAEDATVGDPVVATDTDDADDTDNASILYLLSGDDDPFDIDSGTGQISVGANADLNHEVKDTYVVTVTARDPEGLNSSVNVTIKITDENEAPEISGPSSEKHPEESEGVVAVFTATDPEGKSVTWDVAAADADFSAVDGIETDDAADAALFEMSKSGELTFIDAPSYEAPAGGTSDDSNTYEVVITATDGTGDDAQTAYKKVTVEVTNVDEEPTTTIELSSLQPQVSTAITVDYVDGVGNPLVGADGTANAAIVDPDEDKTGASTTIPADDVKWQWSKSSSKTGRFTDISGAAAKMVTYTPASQDRGMYLRVTATYEDGEGEGKTVMATSAYPVRAFPSGNSAPSFPDDFDSTEDGNQPPTANVDDGATAGDAAGDPVTANDANNDRLTYSLEADSSGTAMHADVFQIDRMTGQVTVGLGKTVGPNGDSGETAARVPGIVLAPSGNEFTVTIKATDPSGSSATVVLTITADERDEAPVFTMGKTSHTHEENKPETEVVATFAAYDPEAAAVTYSLSGDDEGKLSIDSSSGALTFDASPDFEARGSADGDNVYEVTVKASDASTPAKSTSVDVTVTVTNVDEDGSVTLSASQPRIGVEIRANMPTDPDGGVTAVTWQWERADAAAFGETDNVTKIKDATRAGYTPVAADDGKYLRVTATYTDNEGSGKTAIGTPTATDPAVAKVRNLAPKFTDEDEDTDGIQIDPREVAENAAEDATVGDPVVATDTDDADDTDNASILYLLSGDDDPFDIDSGTGQISVGANADLNHEVKDTYVVTVTARDPEGLNSSVNVTIKITDENEPPVIMLGGLAISGRISVNYAENGTDNVGAYTATGPDAASARWSLEGADADDFRLSTSRGASVMLMFASSPDSEMELDADRNNIYMVTLKATDGTYTDTHDVAVTVTNVDEEGVVTLSSPTPTIDTEITAMLTDPDGVVGAVTWQWSKSTTTTGTFMDIDGATSDSYTPADADEDHYLRATATYTDGDGPAKSEMETTDNVVTAGDPLVVRYDADGNGEIEKSEVIAAINDYLDGGVNAPTKADVIKLINLYLGD